GGRRGEGGRLLRRGCRLMVLLGCFWLAFSRVRLAAGPPASLPPAAAAVPVRPGRTASRGRSPGPPASASGYPPACPRSAAIAPWCAHSLPQPAPGPFSGERAGHRRTPELTGPP